MILYYRAFSFAIIFLKKRKKESQCLR